MRTTWILAEATVAGIMSGHQSCLLCSDASLLLPLLEAASTISNADPESTSAP